MTFDEFTQNQVALEMACCEEHRKGYTADAVASRFSDALKNLEDEYIREAGGAKERAAARKLLRPGHSIKVEMVRRMLDV